MHFRDTHQLPVSARTAADRLADPAVYAEAAVRLRADEPSVTVTRAGDGFGVDASMSMPTTDFPDTAARFIGSVLRIEYRQSWSAPDADGGRTGTMTVELPGVPLGCSGSFVLSPTGENACTLTVDGDVTAQIPFMGAKIEKAATPVLQNSLGTIITVAGEGAPQA